MNGLTAENFDDFINHIYDKIFKFVKEKRYFEHFFEPLLAFIIKKGTFNQTEVKVMLDNYLTPNQKQNKMVAQLSLGDKWEARGEARGKKIGKIIGETQKARFTVLRGYFRGQQAELLADICGLPIKDVLDLKTSYEKIQQDWQEKKLDIPVLLKSTTLSEQEIKYVIDCLDSLLSA